MEGTTRSTPGGYLHISHASVTHVPRNYDIGHLFGWKGGGRAGEKEEGEKRLVHTLHGFTPLEA